MSRRSKYVPNECEDIREWIQTVIKEDLPSGDPIGVLKDGTALCKVANAIQPNSAKFKVSKMPFVQMENIAAFLRACSKVGVEQHELFETVDLYEMKDPIQVAITIRSLSRHAHLLNNDLPVIGPKFKEGAIKTPEKRAASQEKPTQPIAPVGISSPNTGVTPVDTSIQEVENKNKEVENSPTDKEMSREMYTKAEISPAGPRNPQVEDQSWNYSPSAARRKTEAANDEEFSFEQSEPSVLYRPQGSDEVNASKLSTFEASEKPSLDTPKDLEVPVDSSYISAQDDDSNLQDPTAKSDDNTWKKETVVDSMVSESPESVKPMSAFSPSPDQVSTQQEEPESPTRSSKPFSLNMRPNRPKGPREQGPSPTLQKQSSVFGSDDDDDNYHTGKINSNTFRGKVNRQLIEFGKRSIKETEEEYKNNDSSLYDYDEVYDVMKHAEQAAKKIDAVEKQERKSKYIGNLLESKSVRDKDRQRAKDIQIQRERELEGDQYADKEMFVTSAYKKQQEEMEKERIQHEKEVKSAWKMGSFHRRLLNQEEQERAKVLKAISEAKESGDLSVSSNSINEDDSLIAKARKINEDAGYEKVKMNEEGELVDSTEILSGGLNILTKHQKTNNAFSKSKEPFQYRQNQNISKKSFGSRKHKDDLVNQMNEVAEKEHHDKLKQTSELKQTLTSSRINESTLSCAKERFLARKRNAQAAKNDQLPHKSPSNQ